MPGLKVQLTAGSLEAAAKSERGISGLDFMTLVGASASELQKHQIAWILSIALSWTYCLLMS